MNTKLIIKKQKTSMNTSHNFRKQKQLRLVFLVCFATICFSILLSLTGCTDIDGDLEKKSEVDKIVASQVVNEKYTFVSVEHYDEERPKRDIYTYQSKERNLTFEVLSTLAPFGIDGGVIGYNTFVDVRYPEAVREYYSEQVEKVLKDFEQESRDRYLYQSFDELEKIADAIVKLSEIYKEEQTYNTAEWMKQNPLCTISFCHERTDYEGYYSPIFQLKADGTLEYPFVYDYITYRHAEAVKNETIQDDTTPEDQIGRVHEKSLENIFYQGENLTRRAIEKAHADKLINNLDSAYYSYYYFPWDTYVIALNCGITDGDYAPKCMEAYADAFGFHCDIKYKKGKISWSFGGSDYQMVVHEEDSHITDFRIYRDGVDLNVPYITGDDELSPIGPTYIVGIPIDSFSELFEKEYVIREEEKSIEFTDLTEDFGIG